MQRKFRIFNKLNKKKKQSKKMPTKINFKDKVNENVCDLSLSELEEIPIKDISLFKRVTVLDLSLNRLVNLGDNFSTLNRLVKLDLSKNQIKYLPEDFGLLRQLRYLDLFGNQLENLPLTFGDLSNLRYLDLHNNPLNAALAKIVGPCLTNRDCQESAKRTVNFMSLMQLEVVKAKKHYMQAMLQSQGTTNNDNKPSIETSNSTEQIIIKPKKSNKKSKSKKKSNSDLNQKQYHEGATPSGDALIITKANKTKRLANGSQRISSHKHNNHNNHINSPNYSAALTSLITFILLLVVNIFLIYMIMFKNPQIAEKLVETIPHQYRDWIISKTEIFRLRVTDWISEFRTPPDEH